MSLNVSLMINGREIKSLTITRQEHFKGAGHWHEYMIRVEGEPESITFYSHLYSDGAETCLRKGLQALERKRGAI